MRGGWATEPRQGSTTISRVENGQKAELRTARKLAQALGVEPHELMAPEQDQGQHEAA